LQLSQHFSKNPVPAEPLLIPDAFTSQINNQANRQNSDREPVVVLCHKQLCSCLVSSRSDTANSRQTPSKRKLYARDESTLGDVIHALHCINGHPCINDFPILKVATTNLHNKERQYYTSDHRRLWRMHKARCPRIPMLRSKWRIAGCPQTATLCCDVSRARSTSHKHAQAQSATGTTT
jgi:hypothetical protein